jgi:hypothetical protein
MSWSLTQSSCEPHRLLPTCSPLTQPQTFQSQHIDPNTVELLLYILRAANQSQYEFAESLLVTSLKRGVKAMETGGGSESSIPITGLYPQLMIASEESQGTLYSNEVKTLRSWIRNCQDTHSRCVALENGPSSLSASWIHEMVKFDLSMGVILNL